MESEPIPEPLDGWVVATAGLAARLATASIELFDPTRLSSAAFLDAVARLDADSYGHRGMRMPRWAFYDCVALPGAVFGLRDERGPTSMILTVPTLDPDRWLAHSLCAREPGRGLEDRTLSLALDRLGVRELVAVTQWTAPELATYVRRGPLELLCAWLPAHSVEATCVFVIRPGGSPAGSGEPWSLEVGDAHALRGLQRRIEGGARVGVWAGPDGGRVTLRDLAAGAP